MKSPEQDYDLAIIGAGVNGAGIARDASLRGLKVIVIDKGDMCCGTSSVSSRLIHGGLRYLEYGEVPLVYESLHERRALRKIASHLVRPLRITIPIFSEARRGKLLVRLGMIAYDLLSFRKSLPSHDMLGRVEIIAAESGVRSDGLLGAARYFDAQVTFAERLVLENLLAARAAGAEIRTYCEVREIRTQRGRVDSIVYVDRNGESTEVSARVVVNAAGPWVDKVLQGAPRQSKRFVGGTKGSHIVVDSFPGSPTDAFYVEAESDGRPFFIIPWNNQYLIGTTDIRFHESLDQIRASRDEVDYLLAETNRVFPGAGLTAQSINYAYAGVRPLPHREKGPESAITRRHIIKHNRLIAKGLISIIGGKLTTYRNLAEQTVDKVSKILRRKLPKCRTDDTLLPGAWGIDEARSLLATEGVSGEAIERLLSIYGGRSTDVISLARSEFGAIATLAGSKRHLQAEFVYAVREEFATTLVDVVFRRTMVGFESNQGRPLYEEIADIVARACNWDETTRNAEFRALLDYAESLRV